MNQLKLKLTLLITWQKARSNVFPSLEVTEKINLR